MTRAIRIQDVAAMCGNVTTQTIRRWADDPALGFPKSFNLSGTVVWDEAEVAAFIQKQKGEAPWKHRPNPRSSSVT